MMDLGNLHHYLGVSVQRLYGGLFLSQEMYATEILARANMSNCKPSTTPVDRTSKLNATARKPLTDDTLYRSLAGSLQYLTFTRPNISSAFQQVFFFMHAPRDPHF